MKFPHKRIINGVEVTITGIESYESWKKRQPVNPPTTQDFLICWAIITFSVAFAIQ